MLLEGSEGAFRPHAADLEGEKNDDGIFRVSERQIHARHGVDVLNGLESKDET